jgi:predicted nucleic acid-binding protein
MSIVRVVLDTNVLVSAFRSREGVAFRLIRLLREGRFEISVSVPLVLE